MGATVTKDANNLMELLIYAKEQIEGAFPLELDGAVLICATKNKKEYMYIGEHKCTESISKIYQNPNPPENLRLIMHFD